MDWRSLLDEGTVRTFRVCVNLVVRASVIALTWGCLLVINLALNWLISVTLTLVGAPQILDTVLSQTVLVFVTILGLGATISGLMDAYSLTKTAVTNSGSNAPSSQKGDDADV